MLKSINIDSKLHKKLKIMAAESGASMAALIEEGLNYILGRTPYNEKISLKVKSTELKIKPIKTVFNPPHATSLKKPRGEIHGEDYI